MRDPAFATCWAKLDRASEHSAALKLATEKWLDTKPYNTRTEIDKNTGVYTARLDGTPSIPSTMYTILGDALHNLRAALDHFIYRVAVIESKSDPPPRERDLGFPSYLKEPDFDSPRNKWLGNLSLDMRTFVKSMQPFSTNPANPRESAFWVLNQLDIIDKHKTFPLALTVVSRIEVGSDGNVTAYGGPDPGLLEDGAQLMAYLPDRPDVNVNLELALQIAFGKSPILPDGWPATELLSLIAHDVETMVGAATVS